MSVYFYSIDPPNPMEDCGYCIEPLEDGVIAHDLKSYKSLHPIHQKCLTIWVDVQRRCPSCRMEIDPYNLDLKSLKKVRFFLNKVNNLTLLMGCLAAIAENYETFSFETSMGLSILGGVFAILSAEVLEESSYRSTTHLLKQASKLTTLYAITIGIGLYGSLVLSNLKMDLSLPILKFVKNNSSIITGIPRHTFAVVASGCLTNAVKKVCKIFKE